MAKKKVDEPFVQMYELKGLKANEALMVNKVWSFQSNGLECYITNKTWANLMGCSPSTVTRIKFDLKKQNIIETDQQYIRLKSNNMQILINQLNDNYQPKYKKHEHKLPYWHNENNAQSGDTNNKTEHTPSQFDEEVIESATQGIQVANQLYNREDNIKENTEETVLTQIWSCDIFMHLNITQLNQINFDNTNSVELRNLILSYWYNCFSTIELVKSTNLFLDENYFKIFTKILRSIPLGQINKNYLIDVDINYFLVFIQVYHTVEQQEFPVGSTVPLRQVVSLIISQINDLGTEFKTFVKPNKN
jgi:hypothetical protein